MNNITQELQLWGGIECTINRVGEKYYDQLAASGHYKRETDLAEIAALGVKALRYPVLWEKHQPTIDTRPDWTWITGQLKQLQQHKITPIAGLLHHGSGSRYTNLLDPGFPEKLAGYALKVAQRFPWIEYYTPVNEPLTTARFTALYGLWYPHKTSDVSFISALLNQVKATVLAMQAIRTVNPAAKLVQTEDLGKTYSTPLLQYQADFENNRRWLTYDLLTGKVVPGHPMWDYCKRLGIDERQLHFFTENICSPSIAGVNYYVTSERYLDHRYKRYSPACYGSNEIHRYADVEAIRVPLQCPSGFKVLVNEFWERYKLPIAITEVHLGCSNDEQMRWFYNIWQECLALKAQGINLVSATAWSLLGAFGWDKLLTRGTDNYESGVFCLENSTLHKTPLAHLITKLANNEPVDDPLLFEGGWWTKPERYLKACKPLRKKMATTAL